MPKGMGYGSSSSGAKVKRSGGTVKGRTNARKKMSGGTKKGKSGKKAGGYSSVPGGSMRYKGGRTS